MELNLAKIILYNNIRFVVLDIDGTVKDLYKEHEIALKNSLIELGIEKTSRAKFALWLNKLGMAFFKWGMLPTNRLMRSVLIWIISLVTMTKHSVLKKCYYQNYPEKSILFDHIKDQLLSLPFKTNIILTSTNNYPSTTVHELCKVFGVEKLEEKKYNEIIQKLDVASSDILVIGDNFFDDYLPARSLGCRTCIVNEYDSKLKGRILKLIVKNPSSN